MDNCCENKTDELAALRDRQSRVLYIVFAINAIMFVVEFTAGWLAESTALLADSLDMFGDASVYAVSLFVLHRSVKARAGAALLKGAVMFLFGLIVIGQAIHRLSAGTVPEAGWMVSVAVLVLAANFVCFIALNRHRSDDLNMKSVWLCSRNDLIANVAVILAAVMVAWTESFWPDILVGLAIAGLFLHSAWQVSVEALQQWRSP